jgi:hypothetical protein
MVGKFRPIFPMIGKIFRHFSNDWKIFSESIFGNKKDKKGNKTSGEQTGQTIPTIPDNCFGNNLDNPGQLLQGAPPNRAASMKTFSRHEDLENLFNLDSTLFSYILKVRGLE